MRTRTPSLRVLGAPSLPPPKPIAASDWFNRSRTRSAVALSHIAAWRTSPPICDLSRPLTKGYYDSTSCSGRPQPCSATSPGSCTFPPLENSIQESLISIEKFVRCPGRDNTGNKYPTSFLRRNLLLDVCPYDFQFVRESSILFGDDFVELLPQVSGQRRALAPCRNGNLKGFASCYRRDMKGT